MRNIFFVLISITLTTPAFAQAKTPESDKADRILHLMNLIGIDKLQQSMMDQMLTAVKASLPEPPDDDARARKMADRFYEILIEEFKKLDFMKDNLLLYDKYFTIDEINGLIQFYESPVGKKAIQVLPGLTQEAMSRGMERGKSVGPRAAARLAEEFPELKKLLPPPGGRQ